MSEEMKPAVILENPEAHARALFLKDHIKAHLSAMQANLYEVCKSMMEMRDGKLYKELGYQGFEDCCKAEFGITRMQTYKYIRIAENLPEDFVKSTLQIGTEKLSLLAMLDAPDRETVIESVDVESVTVRELKAQITALTQERDEAQAAADKKDKQFRQAMESKNNEIVEVKTGWKRRSDMLMTKIKMLQDELKEARTEPQEVAVEDTTHVEELEQQLAKAQSELADANARLAERPMVQEALPVRDTTDAFKAYLSAAADSMKRLLEFVGNRPGDPNHELYLTRIDGVLHLSGTELAKLKGESSCQ